ncbi:MAG: hypothetical protein H7A38_04580 [Chlamydiales bacterium]|nr:hypothetical protein [Chlamydiales bacterium]
MVRYFFLFITVKCFGVAPFLLKDVHLPIGKEGAYVEYTTTRNLQNGALKASLLQRLKTLFDLDVFIETGTYLGDTSQVAGDIFSQVHTIELSEELYRKSCQRFKNSRQIQCHLGDSAEVLPKLLKEINVPALFYLDGHYSGHVTARGLLDTPLMKELEAIRQSGMKGSVLFIDDIRLFQNTLNDQKLKELKLGLETYPLLAQLLEAILGIDRDAQIFFLGDALLACPKTGHFSVSPLVRACTLHRMEEFFIDIDREDLENADQIVMNAIGKEAEELESYYETYSPFELQYGYRAYGAFWYGLLLLGRGKELEGQALLRRVAKESLTGWSVNRWVD